MQRVFSCTLTLFISVVILFPFTSSKANSKSNEKRTLQRIAILIDWKAEPTYAGFYCYIHPTGIPED